METRADNNGTWIRTGRLAWVLRPEDVSPEFASRKSTGTTETSKTLTQLIDERIALHVRERHGP